jgi:hypothetical protein
MLPTPDIDQVTPLVELPETLAVNVWFGPPAGTVALVGVKATDMVGAVATVMVAEDDFVGSATLVALTVVVPVPVAGAV